MRLRRTPALLVAASTALSTTLLGAPATAVTTTQAAVTCVGEAVGVLAAGKLLARRLEDGRQTAQKTSGGELPFQATNIAYAGWERIEGGQLVYYVTTARDGRPRMLTVTDRTTRSTLRVDVARFATTGFTPRLFAMGSAGPQVVALEGGVLRQYKIRLDADNHLMMVNPRVALRRMDGLKTLSWYSRQLVGGVKKDIFYATTKAGALKQIRVPVANPGNAEVLTVKRTGFKAFTGLSLGRCGDTPATAMITGINANTNRARWFTLGSQLSPSAGNLTDRGLAAEGRNWHIRPTV